MNTQEVSNLLLNELSIPKTFFDHTDDYSFPSLITDEKGIFTAECKKYYTYDFFTNMGELICEPEDQRDFELEKFILLNEVTLINFDLDKAPNEVHPLFESTRCNVYPEIIKNIPAVYDTLFLCDYLLKYIARILLQVLVLQRTPDQIVTSNYVLSYKAVEGKYPIANIHKRAGFTKLLNTVRLFALKNKSQTAIIRESYESFKSSPNQIRVNLNFPQIHYSLDDQYLQFYPLVPDINITYGADAVPFYLSFVKIFFEQHYQDIKTAFPIYNRLENIYRLCALVRFRQNNLENIDTQPCDLVYTRTFPDKIMCCGGISLVPKLFVKIPMKDHPLIEKKEHIKECRQAFDNGGFICSFAPKLLIRDCLDRNLKDFHQCLKE